MCLLKQLCKENNAVTNECLSRVYNSNQVNDLLCVPIIWCHTLNNASSFQNYLCI